ncbi:hypothetical protein N7507_005165 [Penicillium longicatenatum]|nr:hypothetical protein N7507_005165 [Penicillium longicatenatum]
MRTVNTSAYLPQILKTDCSLPSYFLKIEPKLATSELSMAAQAFAIFTVTRNLGNVANSEQHANDVGNSGARIVHSLING